VRKLLLILLPALALALGLAGCGDSGDDVTITVVTHDSFTPSDAVLAQFTEDTGITVKVLASGDAGEALNQAILTKDHPEGDVFFGVDNTFLTRALDANLFVPYESPALAHVDPSFVLDPEHRVTPIDYGDVCVNYDKQWFADHELPVPSSLEDLTKPEYDGLLAVENPATSSPGLAFLLATVDRFGEGGWRNYWSALRANHVAVANGWEDAYYGQFSGGSGSEGDRPLVVSYASSPPAEVVSADPPVDEAPIGVVEDGCFRQVEQAGILRGTDHEDAARTLIDFLLSKPFQDDMPLTMFVFPVSDEATLPDVFVDNAATPAAPIEIDPATIGEHRDEWIDEWTATVLQ